MSDDRRPPLTGKASQETVASMQELDPMPMPDSPMPTPPAAAAADKKQPSRLAEGGGGDGHVDAGADGDTSSQDISSGTPSGAQHGHSRSISATAEKRTATSSLGLSGHSGHGAVYYCMCPLPFLRCRKKAKENTEHTESTETDPIPVSRVQRYSSYAFTIFTSIHLATASLIPLATRSVPASESYLLLAREIYQTRLSEPLLVVIPIVAHVAAGVGLRLVRRNQNLRRYYYFDGGGGGGGGGGTAPQGLLHTWWNKCRAIGRRLVTGWPNLSYVSATGYAFYVTLAAHAILNRVLPMVVQGDSSDIGLAYIAHGFARHPVVSWLSYGVFLGAASGHMVWGWAKWLGMAQRASWTSPERSSVVETKALRKRRRRTWLVIQGGVLLAFGAWAAGGLGVVARGGLAEGWVAKVYDGLYDKMLL